MRNSGFERVDMAKKEENRFAVLEVAEVLKEENRLTSLYFYRKSQLLQELKV